MFQQLRAERGERGFTLVELLVVIAIMGVLAGVVVFSVAGITDNSQLNSCKTEQSMESTAIQAFYANTNPHAYPANQAAISAYFVTTPLWYQTTGAGVISKTAAGTSAGCP
jgi:general secretion pathway protein G